MSTLEVVAVDLQPVEVASELIAGPAGAAGPAGPAGPAGQDATLPADVTQAEAEAGTLAADRMWSPERVAQAIAALGGAGGSGGGGGVWDPVETLNVTGAAVQEILFGAVTPLDFSKYEYRLEGLLKTEGNNTDTVVWYAVETTAAAVVAADYVGSIFAGISSLADIQTRDNSFFYHFGVYFPSVFEFTAQIFATTEGRTILSCGGVDIRDPTNTPDENSAGIMFRNVSWNSQSTTPATHFGIYNSAGAFIGAGTSMTLSRRTL